ncbi:hypothetical protein [Crocosphaera sp.]|uniref:hypothetical protein n=1 Tax=Crocosphaera sp. TaxID=2729996 RepID=UPI00261D6607|nr:hypothetical protein [Crocosphaera sp.]
MKHNYFLLLLVFLNILCMPKNAYGDEVWSTEEYNVIYLEDRNKTAVWSYGDGRGHIFIDGLGGQFKDRDSYNGYWTQSTSSRRCDTFREGIDGKPTYHWGRFEITFIDPNFPSRWQAKFGLCDQNPTITLNGTPVKSPID